jgi:DNA-binding transcriptional ArsR family regulator
MGVEEKKQMTEEYKQAYLNWKKQCLAQKQGYFIIFNSFLKSGILREVSGDALRLYIYLGMFTQNYTGETFVSMQTMADYFKKSVRTIGYWLKELEDKGLIIRIQLDVKKTAHTFLRIYPNSENPPSDTMTYKEAVKNDNSNEITESPF